MTPTLKLTPVERELYEERVAIMLGELNPAGMSDSQVEAATVAIEVAAYEQIKLRREQAGATMPKKQAGFTFKVAMR